MGRQVNRPQHWLKYIKIFCDVSFRDSLHSCCRSNLGLAKPQSRMAAHKTTQPFPACCSLFENEGARPFYMVRSKSFKGRFVVSPENFLCIIREKLTSLYVEIKCQLDATEVFIADLTACSTCFGHHYANHQELKSIIQWL